MHSALSESWEGPYVVQQKFGTVNYKIQKDGVTASGKVTHINNLMRFMEREMVSRCDIVTEEQEEEINSEEHGRQSLVDRCSGYNEEELQQVLSKFDCMSDNQETPVWWNCP